MMRGTTKIFRIFGIDIQLHFSWWLVFILLTWSLSSAFFPYYFPGYSTNIYWMMGGVAALLLFVSVLLHELSHSLVAKARKIKVESITLFFFGGVAGINKEDMKPSSEFMMAIAGPIFSLLLAGIFFLIYKLNGNFFWTAITFYLFQLNLILALFNLVPGFPLDGGRALRAILYAYFKDLKKATRIAASGGRFFAIFLIVMGIFSLFNGSGGIWFIFLGGFLYFIAGVSYQQVVLRDTLSKFSVDEIMEKKYLALNPEMTLHDLLKKYANKEEDVFFVKDKTFSGILDLKKLGKITSQMQKMITLKQLAVPLSKVRNIKKKDTAYTAFKSFAEQGLDLIPVMENSRLVGFLRRRVLMHRLILALKYDLDKDVSVNGKNVKKNLVKNTVKKKIKKKKTSKRKKN
ncbi:MAG: site-2 protease family protein [Nanoarchaeota archaeon]